MIAIVCRTDRRDAFALSSYRSRIKRLVKNLGLELCELSIVFVDDDEIQSLNSEYRGKEQPTDVLSFPQLMGTSLKALRESPTVLGDIVLSVPTLLRQAERGCLPRLRDGLGPRANRWSPLGEATFLTLHGLLHLLGYDHIEDADAETMERLELVCLSELFNRSERGRSFEALHR